MRGMACLPNQGSQPTQRGSARTKELAVYKPKAHKSEGTAART